MIFTIDTLHEAGSLFGANSDYAFRGKGRTFGIQARARF